SKRSYPWQEAVLAIYGFVSLGFSSQIRVAVRSAKASFRLRTGSCFCVGGMGWILNLCGRFSTVPRGRRKGPYQLSLKTIFHFKPAATTLERVIVANRNATWLPGVFISEIT